MENEIADVVGDLEKPLRHLSTAVCLVEVLKYFGNRLDPDLKIKFEAKLLDYAMREVELWAKINPDFLEYFTRTISSKYP